MRYGNRIDSNQPEIVNALRSIGCTVELLNAVKSGCPDILVGYKGENYLFEIKTEHGRLTPAEEAWLNNWRGQAAIISSVNDAILFLQKRSMK